MKGDDLSGFVAGLAELTEDQLQEILYDLLLHGNPTLPWPWPGESLAYIRFVKVFRSPELAADAVLRLRLERVVTALCLKFDPAKDHPKLLWELLPVARVCGIDDALAILASRTDCDELMYRDRPLREELDGIRQLNQPYYRWFLMQLDRMPDEGVRLMVERLLTFDRTEPDWPWPGDDLAYCRFCRLLDKTEMLGFNELRGRLERLVTDLCRGFDPKTSDPKLIWELCSVVRACNYTVAIGLLAGRTDCDALEFAGHSLREQLEDLRQMVEAAQAATGTGL